MHIFPDSGLASSLITTVWIGVFVVCFFNLRFGWNLSGLIVPGYMVPLLILKPWSAVAIVIEALFTYFLIWFFSEFCSRLGHWSSLFGRDRFFAIILLSAISRMLFDCLIFPKLTIVLANYFNIAFVYQGGLYSIGLVIVALIANQFWNPGIKRGLPQFLITLLVTFLIIRYLLLNYTNFRISEVAYLYEDVATSIFSSPKAYIILIMTAFLASRFNLLYGWEFGGIVLPGLLALQWYYPWKILSSILEAGIIYGLAVIILKTPLFRNATIEGARKILLFFNIAFAYKMLVGYLLPMVFPDTKIMDVYGLGYMLTSLIAIKMYDKKIGLRMTRITLQTSLLAVFCATIIGFLLLYIPSTGTKKTTDKTTVLREKYLEGKNITEAVLSEQIRLYGISRSPQTEHAQIVQFKNSLDAIKSYITDKSLFALQYATVQLNHLGYKLRIIDNNYILLYESGWKNTRGLFVISLNPKNNLLLKIPLSMQGPGILTSALSMMQNQGYAALAIAGGKRLLTAQADYSSLNNTFYDEFCNVLDSTPSIQLFERDNYIDKKLSSNNQKLSPNTDYYYTNFKPNDLIKNISSFVPNLNKINKRPVNVSANNGIISLFLSQKTILKILSDINIFDIDVPEFTQRNSLYTRLISKKEFFNSPISSIVNLFKTKEKILKSTPLSLQEAKYIDSKIITPIINFTNEYTTLPEPERSNRLKLINFAAHIVGCSLSIDKILGQDISYIVLNTNKESGDYLGGTYLFRTKDFSPTTIEIKNPANRDNLTLGFYLAEHMKSQAIFISGTAESDETFSYEDDITTPLSLFNLTNQIIIRETDKAKTKNAPTVVQVQSLPDPDAPISKIPDTLFLATYHGAYRASQLKSTEADVYKFLRKNDFKIQFISGNPQTPGLEAINSMEARYIPQTKNTHFMVLWLTASNKINPTFIDHFIDKPKSKKSPPKPNQPIIKLKPKT